MGPDALVPAGQYLQAANHAYATIAECDQADQRLDEEFDAVIRQRQGISGDPRSRPVRSEWVGQRRANLAAQRAEAESCLASLGSRVG